MDKFKDVLGKIFSSDAWTELVDVKQDPDEAGTIIVEVLVKVPLRLKMAPTDAEDLKPLKQRIIKNAYHGAELVLEEIRKSTPSRFP